MPTIRNISLCLAAIALVLGLTGTRTEIWDGAYPYVACEFTFIDANGNPISDVQLEVKNKSGVVRHHWPIDDFYIGRVPTSGQDGKLTFHCCGHRFGGTCHTYFYVINIGGCDSPEYACDFTRNGKRIASVPFNDLAFPSDAKTTREERTVRIPTSDQIFGSDELPAVEDLPETTYEFVIVERVITTQDSLADE